MKNTELSSAKRELLNKWLNGQLEEESNGISKRQENSPIPLSFPQQRQLFLELLEPGTPINNLSVCYQLTGSLKKDALEESANRIIARHEVLRSHFVFDQGLPDLKLVNELKITIERISIEPGKLYEQMSKARKLAEEIVLQPFDLSKAPLMRLRLFDLVDDTYIFLVVIHHTIADGWSLGLFLKELITNYDDIINGTSTKLPDLPIQYADFANWQVQKVGDEDYQPDLAYWKNQLNGELPVLELHTDRPRSSRQSYEGGTYRFPISADLTTRLEKITHGENVTLFMSLLTIFIVLLRRYSGQEDLIVGTPIANRNRPELENLVGIFINTLALRTSTAGDPSFRDLVRKVRDVAVGAYAHQDLPFEKLVEELKPARDLSRPPIFQVVFNMQNVPMPPLSLSALDILPLDVDRGVAQFDLSLMITKSKDQYLGTVEYNRTHFESASIDRMFKSYLLLLEDCIQNPDLPLSRLKIVEEKEKDFLLHRLNQTQIDFPSEKCVHHLVEEQASRFPTKTAVVFEAQSLTYSELNLRIDTLAAYLKSLGVDRGVRVGVLMRRSLEIAETLVAVLKAGGTYIPIHDSYPENRVRFILSDADVHVLITNIDLSSWGQMKVHVINLNDEKSWVERPLSLPDGDVRSSDLAYIIYTSGSTGQPKGVMVSHSALTNFMWSMKSEPGLSDEDRLIAVTAFSFDIAALELFLPLIVGATVIIASEEMTTNPYLLSQGIDDHQATIMQATPATWQMLVESDWSGSNTMKALSGGDVLTRRLANKILDRVGTLWNMYGPTETTIWSSTCKVQSGEQKITIGKPINNTQMYILDENLQPLPIGVVGELHIGGDGLANGYLNNASLTSEKFIKDRLGVEPRGRLYKTGDRARYLSDHSIEVLGRVDHQVKINGYRIELGEISTQMMQNPAVSEAIVIARTEASGERRLIAYFVSARSEPIDSDDLRSFLKEKIPTYMIPTVFIPLDSLPLTPNGKLDRAALPVPPDVRATDNYQAPRNEDERVLVNIWQDVLEVEQVGVHDNFFELGGASIQSLQMVAKANMAGFRLSPEHIFEFQTIAELSENITNTTEKDVNER